MGRFTIDALLGAGGMGEVYRAEDTRLKRTVALKRIAPRVRSDPHYRQRFLREAEYASRLNEPHIASIHDVLEDGDETFLVMEYVEGQTLRQRLSQPISIKECLSITAQCATALAAAHEQRIVHGDIKPENIMLTSGGLVKILDFGVAKVFPRPDETATETQFSSQSGLLSGTPTYMAPEVLLEKERDGRADIFSLGVTFYEALTGRHPFRAESFIATTQRVLEKAPPRVRQFNPRVPAELERIVGKMLAKDPQERYATAADLLVDLHSLQHTEREILLPQPVLPVWLGPRRRILAAAATIVMLVLLLLAFPGARDRVKGWFGIQPVPRQKLVAVLPFTMVRGDSQSTPFSDGLTETSTAKLTQLTLDRALQVVPASEIRVRGVRTVDETRREFGATLALLGSLQRLGDQLRINLAVVDTHTHRQLATRTLTVAASDPFAVQDQVVIAAVELLGLEVRPPQREALKARDTQVAGAYDSYLEGRGHLRNYDKVENIGKAIQAFENALQLDPRFASAYAGLGEAHWKMYERTKDTRWVESSQRNCERAVSLDVAQPAAHACLGTLYKGTGRYEAAVAEFKRVIDSEPTNDDAYRGLAKTYELLNKPAEAEATYLRAIEIRPQYWAGYNWLGAFYHEQAKYEKAAEMFAQVVALAPDNVRGANNLGQTYSDLGRYSDAIPILQHSIAIRPSDFAYTDLGNAYFYWRRYDEATQAYQLATNFNGNDALLWRNLGDGYYWTPGKRTQAAEAYRQAITLAEKELQVNPKDVSSLGTLAICHAMLGEKKAALEFLRKGLELSPDDPGMLFKAALVHNHFGDIPQTFIWLKRALAGGISAVRVRDTPDFERLGGEPRFQELLRAK